MTDQQSTGAQAVAPVADQNVAASVQLPDDHPLVKTLAAQKDEIKALKARAARADELEQAQMTESEKAAARIAQAEAEAASVPGKVADALREALVTLGVVSEDRKVLLTATEPQALLEQVRAIQSLPSVKTGRAPLQGRTTSNVADPMRDLVHGLFGGD